MEIKTDPYLRLHIGATSLHYGQACFEGLKAFHCKDGAVRMFRPLENARRLERSCQRYAIRVTVRRIYLTIILSICMPGVPHDLFIDACRTLVKNNLDFVPPYGTGGSLYIRPVL